MAIYIGRFKVTRNIPVHLNAIQTKTVEIQVILIVFHLVILINGVHHTTQEHNSMMTTVTPLEIYNDSIDNLSFFTPFL
jgi:hypothetical protein